jgi:predicted nuclease with TOPRIM domain
MGRMAANLGIMAQNMPQMAYTANRMANTSDFMQNQADDVMSSLEHRGKDTEKTAQKYLQAYVNNDRDMVHNLRGIHKELEDIKGSIHRTKKTKTGATPSDLSLLAQLRNLEAKLKAATERLKELEKRRPMKKPPMAPPIPSTSK